MVAWYLNGHDQPPAAEEMRFFFSSPKISFVWGSKGKDTMFAEHSYYRQTDEKGRSKISKGSSRREGQIGVHNKQTFFSTTNRRFASDIDGLPYSSEEGGGRF